MSHLTIVSVTKGWPCRLPQCMRLFVSNHWDSCITHIARLFTIFLSRGSVLKLGLDERDTQILSPVKWRLRLDVANLLDRAVDYWSFEVWERWKRCVRRVRLSRLLYCCWLSCHMCVLLTRGGGVGGEWPAESRKANNFRVYFDYCLYYSAP